jgi:hypothetical protein
MNMALYVRDMPVNGCPTDVGLVYVGIHNGIHAFPVLGARVGAMRTECATLFCGWPTKVTAVSDK